MTLRKEQGDPFRRRNGCSEKVAACSASGSLDVVTLRLKHCAGLPRSPVCCGRSQGGPGGVAGAECALGGSCRGWEVEDGGQTVGSTDSDRLVRHDGRSRRESQRRRSPSMSQSASQDVRSVYYLGDTGCHWVTNEEPSGSHRTDRCLFPGLIAALLFLLCGGTPQERGVHPHL